MKELKYVLLAICLLCLTSIFSQDVKIAKTDKYAPLTEVSKAFRCKVLKDTSGAVPMDSIANNFKICACFYIGAEGHAELDTDGNPFFITGVCDMLYRKGFPVFE